MEDKSKIVAKAIEKSLYKVYGKLLEAKKVGTIRWTFVLTKGAGEKRRYFALTTSDGIVVSKIANAVRNQRFKAKFRIESVLYKEKWYTNLICVQLDDWIINEEKINRATKMQAKQVEMFEENDYKKSIINNTGFMDSGNKN